jgi:peptidyl-prolyl cis-trans isomerase C
MKFSRSVRCAVLVLLATGLAAAQGEGDPDSVVLTVNGDPVRAAEVRLIMPNLAAQMAPDQGEPDPERIFAAAVEQVVNTKLLAQEARRIEITVGPDELAGIMAQIEERSGGREALESALGKAGVTYGDLEEAVGEGELAQRLVESTIRPGVAVADSEVEAFYAKNPEMFRTPAQVHARHILFSSEHGDSDAERSGAKENAEAARVRALAGEDFAALAKELSQGPSAKDGGDLGFFSAGSMVPAFSEAAFALEPGGISDVVETQFGYHVIKVEERRDGGTRPLDEVREPLGNALLERKVTAAVETMLTKLRSQAEIVPAPGSESVGG